MFATRTTIHSMSRATPEQLVFGRDKMLNAQHEANWTYIKERSTDAYTGPFKIVQVNDNGT
eukprot:3972231-Ditylum_brightwellii.AAC.1